MIMLAHLDHAERDAVRAFDRAIRRFQVLAAQARLCLRRRERFELRRLTCARIAIEEACFTANAATMRNTRWLVAVGRARVGLRWLA